MPKFQRFTTTRWSLVLRAGREDGRRAASELCEKYWWPVYGFFRTLGVREDEAENVTQAFFGDLHRLGDFGKVAPERGRFRSWLRVCAKNHLYRHRKRQKALKRDQGQLRLSVDTTPNSERVSLSAAPSAERLVLEPKDLLTPEHDFNRSWALALHARVLGQLHAHYAAIGKLEIFRSLESALSGEPSEQSDSDLSHALGMKEGTLRVARCRVNKEVAGLYRRYLRAEIGETVSDPEDIDDEIRELLAALSQPPSIVDRSRAGDVRADPFTERRAG